MAVTAAMVEAQREARARAIAALKLDAAADEAAERLEAAADAIAGCVRGEELGVRADVWRAYADGLRALGQLVQWDAAVRSADRDSDRFRSAAKRNSELAAQRVDDEALAAPLKEALTAIASVAHPDQLAAAAAALRAAPLPLQMIPPRTRSKERPRVAVAESTDEPATPLAVCLLSVDGQPLRAAAVVEPSRIYELELTARVTAWPEWAERLVVNFLSVESGEVVTLPSFDVPRPERDDDRLFSASAQRSLVVHAAQKAGAKPFSFPLTARFVAAERSEAVAVAGYGELRVRTFDPSRDFVTGSAQIDARVYDLFAELRGEEGVSEDELAAFCRFFAAHVRAANLMQAERVYFGAAPISERDFHDELERRLRVDPELGGRLTRAERAGGGVTDLVHDGVVSELKVEPERPVSLDAAAAYIGQPTQYAGGKGSHVSILCLLDMSHKQAPVGVLDNYMGWFLPKLHGLDDPRYPSRVAVLVINANLPPPSDWAGRRIETR